MAGTKTCRVCGLEKTLDEFYLDRGVPSYRCKQCQRRRELELRQANREKNRATKKRWVENNRDKMRASNRKSYHKHKAKRQAIRLAYSKAYQKAHPDRACAYQNERNRRTAKATPRWANLQYMRDMYTISRLVSEATGMKHHVDHIVPIKSRLVCGLHVEHNLQVIPALDNHAKFNTQWPDMP